jgi:type IV pilus assembly protein PilB
MSVSSAVQTRRRIGEVLVDLGFLDEEDIQRALELQRSSGRRLGEVLTGENLVTTKQLLQALAEQFGFEFLDLESITIDMDLAQRVPASMARRHRALPVLRRDGVVIVAMMNAADVLAADDIRSAVGEHTLPVMAEGAQIMAAIHELEHSDSRVAEAIQAAVVDSRPATTTADDAPQGIARDESPIVQFVDILMAKAIQERASDVHVEPTAEDLRIRFRIDGVLNDAMSPPKSLESGIISRIKVMADIDIAERRLPQDGRMTIETPDGETDVRVVTVPTVHGEAAVLRILRNDERGKGLSSLGFLPTTLEQFRSAYNKPWGAILVTGPTGSGKSTTLYGTLEELRDPTKNIITIEDPVEYRMEGVKQVQVNARSGMTFPTALRSFLRADPDIILVGEIRDSDTATIAVEASLTGHLVLSTIHTNNAASTPIRLIEMGVQPFLVTSALNAVLAQRLARRLCERCKVSRTMKASPIDAELVPPELLAEDGTFNIWSPVGCPACGDSGYRGRFAIHEVMTMTDEIRELVLTGASSERIERVAVEQGMRTLRQDGLQKALSGHTSLEEILRIVS